jgi:two-component system, sensor histidine kinase and response regulator
VGLPRRSLASAIIGLSTVPLIVLLLFVGIVAWLQQETKRAELLTQHSDDVLALSLQLQNDLAEAGSQARRYILLGTPAYYAKFLTALAIIPKDSRALTAAVKDNPEQLARARSLAKTALSQVSVAAVIMRAIHAGNHATVLAALDRAQFHHPQPVSPDDIFRRDLNAFQAAEMRLRRSRIEAVQRMWQTWNVVLIGSAVVCAAVTLLLALILGGRVVRRLRDLARQAREFARRGVIAAPIGGTDEIADVSRTLREMAVDVKERTALLARYHMLAENASDAMVFQRRDDRRIIAANHAAQRFYGYSDEEFLTIDERDLRADGSYAAFPPTGNFDLSSETEHRRKDGSTFPVEVSMSNATIEGEDIVLNVVRDLTERKAGERAVRDALDRAIEASRAKSEFVATMSHEIRTPMNGVIGATELLLDTPLSAHQREYAATARDCAHSLLGVINNILDFSKIEADKVELDIVDFDLVAHVEGVGSMLNMQAHSKSISLMTYVDPMIPPHVIGDPTHLRQVLVNLVGNAIKFTERGGVALLTDLVAPGEDRIRVAFAVRDTGIGIDEAALPRLFAPFTQADGSTTRKYGGTGLGLAITRRLVQLMGGEIRVESFAGAGSTFSFELEFRTPPAGERPAREDVRGLRALVVDDDEMARDILSRYLSQWGIRVATASSAQAGLFALRTGVRDGDRFDVALLDLRMPHVGGLELGGEILREEALATTKLLLVTAYDALDVGREAIAAGFSAFLTKPVRQSSLYDAIVEARFGTHAGAAAHEPEAYVASSSSARLLLVEDNEVNRRIALRQLEKLGYRAECATNGREALERVANEAFDAILMDCQMPVMDGFEATRVVRKRERLTGTHVPIIAMTANALDRDRDECLAAGMDDYIAKPVELKQLQLVLGRWLDGRSWVNVIDYERLSSLFDGDRVAIDALLDALIRTTSQLCERMQTERDRESLRSLAHDIKGATANAGASELAQQARELEMMCNGSKASMNAIEAAVARVLDAQVRLAASIRSGAH